MKRPLVALLLCAAALAGGCDQLGIEAASATAARKEADGRAVGGACRHAGRAIEDCYALNRRVERAAIYAGWRDMNEYMRENKIDAVAPQARGEAQLVAKPADDGADADHPKAASAKTAKKSRDGAS